MRALPVSVLFLAGFALLAFGPVFVLVALSSFGELGQAFGNALLLLDLGAALAALAAAVLAFRPHPAWRALAAGAGAAGFVAAAGFVLGTLPWTTEGGAVVRVAALHAWAPALLALALVKAKRPRDVAAAG